MGRIKNDSHSGIFVETDFVDVECEHQLPLEILPHKKHLTKLQGIEMQAIIIHKTDKGFGAEVDFIDAAQMDTFIEIYIVHSSLRRINLFLSWRRMVSIVFK